MPDDTLPNLYSPREGEHGMTPLHYAAYCGDAGALATCLDEGADLIGREHFGGIPTALVGRCAVRVAGRVHVTSGYALHGKRHPIAGSGQAEQKSVSETSRETTRPGKRHRSPRLGLDRDRQPTRAGLTRPRY